MTHTPAQELRAAADKLRDDRNCDGYTVDSNSRELLGMIRILLNSRVAIADWLDSWTGIEISEHGPMDDDLSHALTVARAINGKSAPDRARAGLIVDNFLGSPS